eukprot:1037266_1
MATLQMVIEAILKLKDPTKKQIVVYLEKNHELSGSKMTADVSSILKKGKKDGSICSGSTSHRYKLCSGSKDQQSSKVSKAETNHKKKKPTKKDKTKPPPQPKYEWIPAVSPWDCCGEHPDVLKREDTLAVSKILATQMESIAQNAAYKNPNNKRYQSYQIIWQEYLAREYFMYGKAHKIPQILMDDILRKFPK